MDTMAPKNPGKGIQASSFKPRTRAAMDSTTQHDMSIVACVGRQGSQDEDPTPARQAPPRVRAPAPKPANDGSSSEDDGPLPPIKPIATKDGLQFAALGGRGEPGSPRAATTAAAGAAAVAAAAAAKKDKAAEKEKGGVGSILRSSLTKLGLGGGAGAGAAKKGAGSAAATAPPPTMSANPVFEEEYEGQGGTIFTAPTARDLVAALEEAGPVVAGGTSDVDGFKAAAAAGGWTVLQACACLHDRSCAQLAAVPCTLITLPHCCHLCG
jgi:hypothetical protein